MEKHDKKEKMGKRRGPTKPGISTASEKRAAIAHSIKKKP